VPPPPVVVHPEPQRFSLDGNEYFIEESVAGDVRHTPGPGGYWLVPHIIDTTVMPATARPATAIDPIPDALKFNAANPDIATMDPYPERDYSILGEHFIPQKPNFYAIDFAFLKRCLDDAERADYEFALRMQGLQNCSINAVWTCADLGFDAYDRSLIMEQFLRGYVGRFLSQVSQKPGRDLNPEHVVREAIQMHDKFCDAWVKEHKRGLAPLVESCAEALVGNFCESVLKMAEVAGLTRREISRMLRRDPVFAPQFGLCLHFFMVKLDQDRSGRNANYKSMFNSMSSNILALKTFENFMRSKSHLMQRHLQVSLATVESRCFHFLTADWYGIVTQLHAPRVSYTGINKRKRSSAAGQPVDGALGPAVLWGA